MPCLLIRAFEWKIHARQAIDGIDEFTEGERDAVVWICFLGDGEAPGTGDGSQTGESAPQAQSGGHCPRGVGYE